MLLPFSTQILNKPSFFVEKIWASQANRINNAQEFYNQQTAGKSNYEFNIDVYRNCHPKLHTIRLDYKNRWKPGNKIHPVIFNRSSKQQQFIFTLTCIETQKLDIWVKAEHLNTHIACWVNNHPLTMQRIRQLAINDGFDSVQDFANYFAVQLYNSTGRTFGTTQYKLIYWTDLKY